MHDVDGFLNIEKGPDKYQKIYARNANINEQTWHDKHDFVDGFPICF